MPTEVTRSIPVTARFDGCWCAKDCIHQSIYGNETMCTASKEHRCYTGNPYFGAHVRTRWCCETFGMGQTVKEPLIPQLQEPRRYDE